MWMADESGRLTDEQMGAFREAIQELRFKLMADGTQGGSGAIEQALYEDIDGKEVRDVIAEGFAHETERLEYERNALKESDRNNGLMKTMPGDTASKDYLAKVSETTSDRLKAAEEALARAKKIASDYSRIR